MLIEQFVDEGLGNSSYLLASEKTGLAVLIDAERDVDRYLGMAEGLGLRLTHALDTHLHNDFLSGAREAAARAGLIVGASADAGLAYDHLPLAEGSTISLGDLRIETLTTPGHTPEHVSFAVREAEGATISALFTGGALIVGGAARTDLLGPDMTETLTRLLYRTIHGRLLELPDEVLVYPTHGAGSYCAAPAASSRTTTIGQERLQNSLVRARSEAEFMAGALEGLPSYPAYFRFMRDINRRGPQVLGGLPILTPLSAHEVRNSMEDGVAVIDTRSPLEFMAGHIPGSFAIPIGAPLITWIGWVVPYGSPLILIAERPAELAEAVRQLVRIGYDDLRGRLEGGVAAWQAAGFPTERVPVIPPRVLLEQMESRDAPVVLDVRQRHDWQGGHIPGARHLEAEELAGAHLALSRSERIVVHCGHANRSTVAIALLAQQGYHLLALLDGGFSAWEAAGYPVQRDDT